MIPSSSFTISLAMSPRRVAFVGGVGSRDSLSPYFVCLLARGGGGTDRERARILDYQHSSLATGPRFALPRERPTNTT